MKKIFVYVLLTSIIMVPIVSIIVVEILNQYDMTYTTYSLSYDYDDLEKEYIKVEDIEEVLQCKGKFTGSDVDTYTCNYLPTSTLICNYEVGDYIEKGKCIFSKDGEEYYSNNSGVISKINVGEDIINIDIMKDNVTEIEVPMDVSLYPSVSKTSIYFTYGGKDYQFNYKRKKTVANNNTALFDSYYDVKAEKDFIYGGEIDLHVKTGNVHKNTFIVPRKCVFKEGDLYYIEQLDSNGISKINVTLGLSSEMTVEISPEDGYNIKGGECIVVNDINVFNESKESSTEER